MLGRGVSIRTGVAARRSDVDFYLQDGAYRNEWNIVVPAVHATWKDQYADAAGYADGTWRAGRFEVGAGVRADWSGLTSTWYAQPANPPRIPPVGPLAPDGELGPVPGRTCRASGSARTPPTARSTPVLCVQTTAGVEGGLWGGACVTVEGFWKRYTGYPIDPAVPSRVLISAGTDFESPIVGKLVPSGEVHADGVDTLVVAALSAARPRCRSATPTGTSASSTWRSSGSRPTTTSGTRPVSGSRGTGRRTGRRRRSGATPRGARIPPTTWPPRSRPAPAGTTGRRPTR